jgi:osmotically-inducible protein OsmY
MKRLKSCLSVIAVVVIGSLAGCSTAPTKAADVADSIHTSLDQAGIEDVSVTQDRGNGVVTLSGHVAAEADKSHAESIARSLAGQQVVANMIAVIPPGDESDAKKMNSDLDQGIGSNLDAALINNKLHDGVKFDVKNHVVTLTGEVDSQDKRAQAEQIASTVPNVQ